MDYFENLFLFFSVVLIILFIIVILFSGKKRNKFKLKKSIKFILLILIFINILSYITIKRNNKINIENQALIEDSLNEDKNSFENKENINDKNNIEESTKPIIKDPNIYTKKGFKIEKIDGVTYIDGHLIANKTYLLPSNFIPKNTYKTIDETTNGCQTCINKEAYDSFTKMKNDARSLGLNIWIQSGYRSYSYQVTLYNRYVKNHGKNAADTFSARPGASEHQTALSFDLNSISDAFINTDEGKWVNDNCYKYGFIIRFPKNKENETGYKYESWHLRYVGNELAKKLYNNGDWLSMEDYFGITSKYEE